MLAALRRDLLGGVVQVGLGIVAAGNEPLGIRVYQHDHLDQMIDGLRVSWVLAPITKHQLMMRVVWGVFPIPVLIQPKRNLVTLLAPQR